jgi:hypothetical protein
MLVKALDNMKLTNIIRGWYTYITADESTKQRMADRISICDVCPYKEVLDLTGEILASITNDVNNLYRCGKCKCPLGPKTASNIGKCPEGKW